MKYSTKQRKTLVAFFSSHREEAFTTEELVARVSVVESTLYRLLKQLADEGIIKKLPSRGRIYAYQYVEKEHCPNHMHIRCSRCGRIEHLDEGLSERIESMVEQNSGFEVLNTTMLEGLCSNCRDKR